MRARGGVLDKVALGRMFDAEYEAFLELARALTTPAVGHAVAV